jgi:hypothetical protein
MKAHRTKIHITHSPISGDTTVIEIEQVEPTKKGGKK